MSTRIITTATIRCDGPDCDEVYADVVPVSEPFIRGFARRDGWMCTESGDYCPKCVKAGASKKEQVTQ